MQKVPASAGQAIHTAATLSRRMFAQTLAGLALGAALPGCSTRDPTLATPARSRRERIVVIGAGVAGLAAARQLRQQGFAVTVLEARKRIGGRIESVDIGGQRVDLGAQWIEGIRQNPVYGLCKKLDIKTIEGDQDSLAVYDLDGYRFSEPEIETYYGRADALIKRTEQIDARRSAGRQLDISVADALAEAGLDQGRKPREARFLRWAASWEIETSGADDAQALSLRSYWSKSEGESYQGEDHLLSGGYGQVPALLARDLDDIRFEQVVRSVGYSNQGVTIDTGREHIRAARAIVTLPLGVLKARSVRFEPELPPAKLQVIAALGVGVAHRIVLRFGKAFWPNEAFLGYTGDVHGQFVEWTNLAELLDAPILSIWSHGRAARALERGGPAAAVAAAMTVIRKMFGAAARDPIAARATSWGWQPFSLGAHLALPLGTEPAMLDVLAKPVAQRLFFAGEATIRRHYATVHGAYLSGIREADRIAAVAD